jgi:aminoglycoside phosphotransferase (APT) family kinase protein
VSQAKPALRKRIDQILAGCDRLGASVPKPRTCGIHRDFYPAQVLIRKDRLFLLDFDLYCAGDPGLDAGNFLGHMIEESLRTFGDADALSAQQRALEERFVELSGAAVRPAVHAYTTLTLVRHIYLSTQFAGREAFTERLIELCRLRLAQAVSVGGDARRL